MIGIYLKAAGSGHGNHQPSRRARNPPALIENSSWICNVFQHVIQDAGVKPSFRRWKYTAFLN
jgi:hypothetical protein